MDKKFISEFLKGSAASTFGSVASMAFHFVSVMLLTRYLSKEEFGLYVLIIATMYLFNLFAGFGLGITLTKFISSENKIASGEILSTVILTRSIPLVLVVIVFIFVGKLVVSPIDPNLTKYISLIPVLIIVANYRDLFNNLLQGLKLFKMMAIAQVSSAVFRVVLIILGINFKYLDLNKLVLVEILAVLSALVIQLTVVPFRSFTKFKASLAAFKTLIKFAFPLYLNSLLTFVYDKINLFIISIYLTAESVAYYDVADKIPESLKKLFYSFIMVYFPNIANLFSQEKYDDAKNLMQKSLNIISAAISFGVLASFIFKEEIVTIIFSSGYLASATAFSLLMFNFYLRAISNVLGYSLVSAGYSSTSIKTNSVASLFSITGSLVLIPQLGFIGAVYSLLLMNLVSQVIYTFFLRKYIFTLNTFEYLKPLLLLVVFAGFYALLGAADILVKIIFIIVYITTAWFLLPEVKTVSAQIVNLVKSRFSK